jgi:hypothetical protein
MGNTTISFFVNEENHTARKKTRGITLHFVLGGKMVHPVYHDYWAQRLIVFSLLWCLFLIISTTETARRFVRRLVSLRDHNGNHGRCEHEYPHRPSPAVKTVRGGTTIGSVRRDQGRQGDETGAADAGANTGADARAELGADAGADAGDDAGVELGVRRICQ